MYTCRTKSPLSQCKIALAIRIHVSSFPCEPCRTCSSSRPATIPVGTALSRSGRLRCTTASQTPPDKEVLRLNLDETSITLHQGGRKGNVFVARGLGARQRVPLWKKRCALTHVALVCDQPHLQPRMPQLLIGNWIAFTARAFVALRAACPPNVDLVRQRSSWNNHRLLISCLAKLAVAAL